MLERMPWYWGASGRRVAKIPNAFSMVRRREIWSGGIVPASMCSHALCLLQRALSCCISAWLVVAKPPRLTSEQLTATILAEFAWLSRVSSLCKSNLMPGLPSGPRIETSIRLPLPSPTIFAAFPRLE